MKKITKFTRNLRSNQTTAEKLIWAEIRGQKLGVKFRRQHPLIYTLNDVPSFFICDFACLSRKIIIEIDGKIHEHQVVRDKARENIIKNMGFTIIRFNNEMIIERFNEVKEILLREINKS